MIPLIVGAAALAAGGLGAKKIYDAKQNYNSADERIKHINEKFEKTKSLLEKQKTMTQESLENLGFLRIECGSKTLANFVEIFKNIRNISFTDIKIKEVTLNINESSLGEVEKTSHTALEVLKDGTQAVSAGILAGIGAGGLASSIGVASTGTAIGSLSGVAATNATLAWLGGGALSAGGLGMAGGMAVLGGAIAGPAIAIAGLSMAKKSEEAMTKAIEHEADAQLLIEKMQCQITSLEAIMARCSEIHTTTEKLQNILDQQLIAFGNMIKVKSEVNNVLEQECLVRRASFMSKSWIIRFILTILGMRPKSNYQNQLDFKVFSEKDKNLTSLCAKIAKALNDLVRTEVFDDEGVCSTNLVAIENGQKILQEK